MLRDSGKRFQREGRLISEAHDDRTKPTAIARQRILPVVADLERSG
jgi:hypothetical protein